MWRFGLGCSLYSLVYYFRNQGTFTYLSHKHLQQQHTSKQQWTISDTILLFGHSCVVNIYAMQWRATPWLLKMWQKACIEHVLQNHDAVLQVCFNGRRIISGSWSWPQAYIQKYRSHCGASKRVKPALCHSMWILADCSLSIGVGATKKSSASFHSILEWVGI